MSVSGTSAPGNADGRGDMATFYYPAGLAINSADDLFVGDFYQRIRLVQRISGM